MAIHSRNIDGGRCIVLADDVDITQVSDLKQALTEAIGSAPRVSIQVSAVTSADVTIAQLLWAVSSCSFAGTEIAVEGPWTSQVEGLFQTSGLMPLLQSMVQSSAGKGADVLDGCN